MEEKQFYLTPDLADRLAAIDIGTNSIRLIVAEPLRGGNYRILDEEKETTRLGESLARTGELDAKAMEKALGVLRRMKQIAEGFQVTRLKTIATCAVREATNGGEFCQRAKEELGLEIEVINAKQEALLAFFSVQRSFDLADKHVAVADIGGGSTEIVMAHGNLVEAIYTTQLGAVRLTELFSPAANWGGTDFDNLVSHIDRHLRKHTRNPLFIPHILYGSGGTFTSLASVVMATKGQSNLPVRGYQVSRAEVRHTLERLRKMSFKDRLAVPGLSPDRADIIVAGVTIIDRIMDRLKVNMLQVHNRGVRDGLLLTMIDQSFGTPAVNTHDRETAIDRLANACGGEIVHGRHVAKLAGLIFNQIRERYGLDPNDHLLLDVAARLQDVGYLINYEQHHKHSYHLILNSRLQGFQPQELELISNVARYHRGAEPKRKHRNFRRLSRPDQERVRKLAAILRLAGGFDRSHSQQVETIDVRIEASQIEMLAASNIFPEVDIWGARRRTEMFESVFETKLQIGWRSTAKVPDPPTKPEAPATNGNGKQRRKKAEPATERATGSE